MLPSEKVYLVGSSGVPSVSSSFLVSIPRTPSTSDSSDLSGNIRPIHSLPAFQSMMLVQESPFK